MKAIAMLLCAGLAVGAAAAAEAAAQEPERIARLPLVEVPATAPPLPQMAAHMAVLVSGDGGWASLDQSIAESFARRGIPTVGLNSLKYFWSGRKPEEAASDMAATIEHYAAKWQRSQVNLVGFSFGADVLPFIANRLPAGTAARLATITLIEPSDSATFQIHLADWLPGVTTPGLPLGPEIVRLKPVPLCLYGDRAPASCRGLPVTGVMRIGSGHHLGGDGGPIVDRILR